MNKTVEKDPGALTAPRTPRGETLRFAPGFTATPLPPATAPPDHPLAPRTQPQNAHAREKPHVGLLAAPYPPTP